MVAMATPKDNYNCRHVQYSPHRCKIKLEKFDFDILCFLEGVESFPPPGDVRINSLNLGSGAIFQS